MSWLSDILSCPSARAVVIFWLILRPKMATLRPLRVATSITVCARCRFDPNVATIRRPGASRMYLSKTGTRLRSDGHQPFFSTLTVSEISRRTPSSPICAKRGASNRRPSIGVWSILKSEECTTVPTGDRMIKLAASGSECVTCTASMLNSPSVTGSSSGYTLKSVEAASPCSPSFSRTIPSVSGVP